MLYYTPSVLTGMQSFEVKGTFILNFVCINWHTCTLMLLDQWSNAYLCRNGVFAPGLSLHIRQTGKRCGCLEFVIRATTGVRIGR